MVSKRDWTVSWLVASFLMLVPAVQPPRAADTTGVAPAFVDPGTLHVRKGVVEQPSEPVFAWGRETLAELEVSGLTPEQTATRIAQRIHDSFAFTPDRLPNLDAFLEQQGGNCYAHARLGAFMLRLAGVPSRFVYEVHLEHKSPSASEAARERGIGLFGQYHNDHFWVLYYDGRRWVPFDSTLGIANYDDFIRVKVEQPAGGVANPPFLLFEESPEPDSAMVNVTAEFWRQVGVDTLPRVAVEDWRALLDSVGRFEVDDMMRPLSAENEATIARVARPFFGVAPGDE